MYLKLKALKWAAITSCGLTATHLFAHGYLAVERRIGDYINQYQSTIVASLATRAGFERKPLAISLEESIELAAIRHRLNPALFKALVHVESTNDPYAISPAGAMGLAQVMPFNAKRCGLSSPGELLVPVKNLECGAKILSQELDASKDLHTALQRYNGGPKCVNRCAESIRYASKVLNRLARDTRLETITDRDREELDTLIAGL